MKSIRPAINAVMVFALMSVAPGILAQAQRRAYGLNDGQVQQIINRLETGTSKFQRSLNTALNSSRLNGTWEETDINNQVRNFQNATGRMSRRNKDRALVAADVEAVLNSAETIDDFMRRNGLAGRASSDWAALRPDPTALANNYSVASNQNPKCVNRGVRPSFQFLGPSLEGTDNTHSVDILTMLEIFREKIAALRCLGCSDNQSIPEGEAKIILNGKRREQHRLIADHGIPSQEILDFRPNYFPGFWIQPAGLHIELLQNLKTYPSTSIPPERIPPGPGSTLLRRITVIKGIQKNIRVNEDGPGHVTLLVKDSVRRSLERACAPTRSARTSGTFARKTSGFSQVRQDSGTRSCLGERLQVAPIVPLYRPLKPSRCAYHEITNSRTTCQARTEAQWAGIAYWRNIARSTTKDRSRRIDVPGQSEQPCILHYGDLLPLWLEGKCFPVGLLAGGCGENRPLGVKTGTWIVSDGVCHHCWSRVCCWSYRHHCWSRS
jgi:hypothetical protein